jgi:hypothetical protein
VVSWSAPSPCAATCCVGKEFGAQHSPAQHKGTAARYARLERSGLRTAFGRQRRPRRNPLYVCDCRLKQRSGCCARTSGSCFRLAIFRWKSVLCLHKKQFSGNKCLALGADSSRRGGKQCGAVVAPRLGKLVASIPGVLCGVCIRVRRPFGAELQALSLAEAVRPLQSSKLQPSICCIQAPAVRLLHPSPTGKLQAPAVRCRAPSSKLDGPLGLSARSGCAGPRLKLLCGPSPTRGRLLPLGSTRRRQLSFHNHACGAGLQRWSHEWSSALASLLITAVP